MARHLLKNPVELPRLFRSDPADSMSTEIAMRQRCNTNVMKQIRHLGAINPGSFVLLRYCSSAPSDPFPRETAAAYCRNVLYAALSVTTYGSATADRPAACSMQQHPCPALTEGATTIDARLNPTAKRFLSRPSHRRSTVFFNTSTTCTLVISLYELF